MSICTCTCTLLPVKDRPKYVHTLSLIPLAAFFSRNHCKKAARAGLGTRLHSTPMYIKCLLHVLQHTGKTGGRKTCHVIPCHEYILTRQLLPCTHPNESHMVELHVSFRGLHMQGFHECGTESEWTGVIGRLTKQHYLPEKASLGE